MTESHWVEDANGNRCSISYFGSRKAAQAALDSLENCKNCTNCSLCSDCSGCSGCRGCSDCSDCRGCSDCSLCSLCSGCSDCSHLAYLYNKTGVHADPTLQLDVGAPPIPRIDNIHQRVWKAVSQPMALDMGTWHTCETTHCRAGWVVTLAGEGGKKLEAFHNTELAAILIYRESGYPINPARLYDGNEAALADLKKLAEESVGSS